MNINSILLTAQFATLIVDIGIDFVFRLEVEDGPPSASAIPEGDIPPGGVDNLLADDDGAMALVPDLLVGVCYNFPLRNAELLTLTTWTGYIPMSYIPPTVLY